MFFIVFIFFLLNRLLLKILFIYLHWIGGIPFQYILEKKKRYACLVTCEPRKLTKRKTRDGIVVLHAYKRGATITHCCFTGFPRTYKSERGIVSSTLEPGLIC